MKYRKALFSLPEPLLKDIERYAKKVANGNKSGLMTKAAESYIDYLHRIEHTKKMREAYQATAVESRRIARDWRFVDSETARMLDNEKKNNKQ